MSLLRTARAPLTVVALAAIALVLPPQSSDMLAALADGSGAYAATFWFYVSLALLTFSGWYWTRALIEARFDGSDADQRIDAFAYAAVPWLVFVLTFLLGVGLILRSATWWASVPLVIWLVLLLWFWPGRRPYKAPSQSQSPAQAVPMRSTNVLREWWRGLLPRFLRLMNRAPGGLEVAAIFVGLAGFFFLWGAFASFADLPDPYVSLPLAVAALFQGPGAALFVAALIIAPLSVITFLADGYRIEFTIGGRATGPARPPVIIALAIWIAVAPWLFHLHTVRVTETVAQRQPLEKIFQEWTAACAPGTGANAPVVQPIIVAISGGASRAGVWGAQVLQEAEAVSAPGRAVFAVSSVSGGSLGAAAYMALLGALTPEELCANGGPTDKRKVRAQLLDKQPLGHDVLGALLAGALGADIPRNILSPVAAAVRVFVGGQPRGGDRAEAIERAFEALWGPINDDRLPFGAPYLLLFYKDLAPQSQPPAGTYRAGMPLWIANGTDAGTGSRLVTVPFVPKVPAKGATQREPFDWPFDGAIDVLSALKSDVRISTAINNTARFPYLEPSGELLTYWPRTASRSLEDRVCDQVRVCKRGTTEIIDGGYFENEGLQTALELANWLATDGSRALGGRPVVPIIIQATGDGSAKITPAEVVRYQGARDDPTTPHLAPAPLQILAPVLGLNAVRSGHSSMVLHQARDEYGARFFHFFLPGDNGREVPLNWVLSDATTAFIRGAIQEEKLSGNKAELERLKAFK
jgi:hypothetical protein